MEKIKLWKRYIGLLVVTALLLIFFMGTANAKDCGIGVADCECGDTVVADWTFTGDLRCPSETHGLTVGADGITIDGAGFKITGSETASVCDWVGESNPGTGYCGIFNLGHDNIVITNLELEKFCTGIGLQGSGANPVVSNTIENCEVHDNGNATCTTDTATHGIHACYVHRCTISNNRIYSNTGTGAGCGDGGNGIFLYAGGKAFTNNTITKNKIYNNRKGGFFTKKGLQHAKITDNHVYGNGQGGIILRCRTSNYNLIEGNNASGNYGDGIFIGSEYNKVRNNVVKNNMAGFKIKSKDAVGYGNGINMGRNRESNSNELLSNEVCGNEGVDISVEPDCSGNHGRDNTCDTTSNHDDDGATGCTNGCPEELNAEQLARELKEQGWVVYGAEWCGACKKQKTEFGDAFQHVNYVDCGNTENPNPACKEAGIGPIPCWVSPNGTHHTGYKNLVLLSELASEYRVAAEPTAMPVATPMTPGFGSVFAMIAVIVVTVILHKRKKRC